tara:strand:- start:1111 stop:1671 length:561 start_codon:yes stop_codon:yes gene_type:complete
MNSVQESKNELNAAIRYAENAISSAKETIESMEFRQEMAKKQYSEQTGREQALEREVANLKECLKIETAALDLLREDTPTMPVIPKAVAIAIFREGMAYGAGNVCDELDNATDIEINETGYTGGFEVNFTKYFDLSDELDLDHLRSKAVDNSDEEWVVDCLKTLCADNKFECRIHGVDDQEEKKND